jgi:hypothetical protein
MFSSNIVAGEIDNDHCFDFKKIGKIIDCHDTLDDNKDKDPSDTKHSEDCACDCHLSSANSFYVNEFNYSIYNPSFLITNFFLQLKFFKLKSFYNRLNRPPIALS